MSILGNHPLMEKQKVFFRLGTKYFKCNQCGKRHRVDSQNVIDKCLKQAMEAIPPADLKKIPLYQWLCKTPDLFEKLIRAKLIDNRLAIIVKKIEEIFQEFGVSRTRWYIDVYDHWIEKVSLLSLSKEDLETVLRDKVTGDATKESQVLLDSAILARKVEEWVEYVLSGKLYKDNPSEHTWNPWIEENMVRCIRSFGGNHTEYSWDVGDLLGELKYRDCKITPEGIQFRNRATGVLMTIPFDYKKNVKVSLEH